MKLKPFYSIQDLADILDVEVYTVADGLVACGVPAFHIGKEIVLAKYDCFKPPRMGGEMYVFTSTRERPAEPEPTTVIVSTAKLPPLWIEYIEKSNLPDNEAGRGTGEQETLPIQGALETAIQEDAKPVPQGDSNNANQLVGKAKTTALKIIGGMAIDGYRIDIHAARMEGIGDLVKDLQVIGADVTEKTLREWLKDAATVIEKKKYKS